MGHFLLHLLQVDILVGMTTTLVATHISPSINLITSPTNQANPIMGQINLTINPTNQTSLTTNQM
jgi:hypothetical protein